MSRYVYGAMFAGLLSLTWLTASSRADDDNKCTIATKGDNAVVKACKEGLGLDWAEPTGFGTPSDYTNFIVLEDTPTLHHVIVCTLCSCYPRMVLGLPPDWYKSRAYRSRAVREPRAVLAEFGTVIAPEIIVRVHDSTADMRYLVLPERPAGSDGMSEAALAALVTRDSMIGVALARQPESFSAD